MQFDLNDVRRVMPFMGMNKCLRERYIPLYESIHYALMMEVDDKKIVIINMVKFELSTCCNSAPT